jgi:DNA-binding IclR family transcriptional regulator
MESSGARGTRNPIARAFTILRWMTARDDGPWGVREIAKGVGMSPSTVHRLLGLLEEEHLIGQDARDGRYQLGMDFLRLAWQAAGMHPVRESALPHLRELATVSGETATLGLYDPVRRQTCVVGVVESDAPFRFVSTLYEWRDLHAGASGRAVMAFLPEAERQAIIASSGLAAATEKTITRADELERVLAEVRERGYAVSVEERRIGGVGVAAPVFGMQGQVIGEVGVSIPAQRYDPDDEERLAALVLRCARSVTEVVRG